MQVTLPPLHPRQREVADDPSRFRVLSCGRRWGKTRLGAALCIEVAGQRGRAWWVAPSYPVAMVGWRLIRRMASQIPSAEIRQVDRIISLPNGGEIQVRSADNPNSLRGEGLDFVVMDECAYISEDAWQEALRPALSDRLGKAMFISTPAGRNWFWRMWQTCESPDHADWRGWQLPTSDNPYIDAGEIAAARQSLPERVFRQEYLAEFIDDGGGVFRGVMAVSTGAVTEPIDGPRYIMGIDWAFSNDYTVVSVFDPVTRRQVYLDRYNGADYTLQRQRIESLCHRYQPVSIIAEVNSMGRPNNEQLRAAGLPVQDFVTSNASKASIIEALAGSIERADVVLLNDPVQIGELQAYEGSRTTGGMTRYSAPEGMHDDTVIATALAYYGIGRAWYAW
jgi:hypothetical protein